MNTEQLRKIIEEEIKLENPEQDVYWNAAAFRAAVRASRRIEKQLQESTTRTIGDVVRHVLSPWKDESKTIYFVETHWGVRLDILNDATKKELTALAKALNQYGGSE